MSLTGQDEEGNYFKGVIEIADEDFVAIQNGTKCFNGELTEVVDFYETEDEILKSKKERYEEELNNLYTWFEGYDNQIKQYERDKRLNIQGSYHIAENEYTIDELDALAVENAERITALRQLIK